MTSLQAKLQKIYAALNDISSDISVYHYTAPSKAKIPYIVWNEEDEGSSLEADNHKAEQSVDGFIEFFTFKEFDPIFDDIQTALNEIEGFSWRYENTVYGDPASEDTNAIHHTWSWRIS